MGDGSKKCLAEATSQKKSSPNTVHNALQATQDLQRCPDIHKEFGLSDAALDVCQKALALVADDTKRLLAKQGRHINGLKWHFVPPPPHQFLILGLF